MRITKKIIIKYLKARIIYLKNCEKASAISSDYITAINQRAKANVLQTVVDDLEEKEDFEKMYALYVEEGLIKEDYKK